MKKIRQKIEKRERNEEYAKKFETKKSGRQKGVFANWCRTDGHAPNCRCAYR